MDMLLQSHPVLAVVTFLFVWKLIELGGNFFFKKLVRDDYITKSQCEECSARQDASARQDESAYNELCDRLTELRGIVLVVAVKAGVSPEELKDLTKV